MIAAAHKALDFVAARRNAALSDETLHILLLVFSQGALPRERIAAATAINATTLPRYIAQLVASGHLCKHPDTADRRVVVFDLSEHGRRLVAALLRHFPEA